jgi:hypothetical protein
MLNKAAAKVAKKYFGRAVHARAVGWATIFKQELLVQID